ncbi:MAG TPA: phage holin family protein [Pirellulaceae bacterium]
MVHKTSLNGHVRGETGLHEARSNHSEALLGKIAGLFRDATRLTELQIKLFSAEWHAAKTRVFWPLIVLSLAVALLCAALPVVILGAGYAIAEHLQVPLGSLLIALGGGLVLIAMAIIALAARRIVKSDRSFARSRSELRRSLEWIVHTLSRSKHTRG